MFLYVCEWVLIILFLVFIVSQVIIPLFRGTVLFPMVGTRESRLQRRLAEMTQEELELELAQQIKDKEVELTELKRKLETNKEKKK